MKICLINGSPHRKGFSDKIYETITKYCTPHYSFILRDMPINFCTHCKHCENYVKKNSYYTKEICPLHQETDYTFFTKLYKADAVILIAPIYFYHLPSHLKAYIDRGQAAYVLNEKNKKIPHSKNFHAVLHAGRDKGENLFTSSLLSLQYFFMSFNYKMGKNLLLKKTDSTEYSSYQKTIDEYIQTLF